MTEKVRRRAHTPLRENLLIGGENLRLFYRDKNICMHVYWILVGTMMKTLKTAAPLRMLMKCPKQWDWYEYHCEISDSRAIDHNGKHIK